MADILINIQEFNERVEKWANTTNQAILFRLTALSLRGRGELSRSLKYKVKYADGQAYRVSFSFARHGIFIHLGVGRGSPKTAPVRPRRDWIRLPIDQHLEELADIAAEYYGDKAMSQISDFGVQIKIR